MEKIKKLNLIVNYIIKNYNIKLTDYQYIDQVILHDAQDQFFLELDNNDLQYVKAAIKMIMYKRIIEDKEKRNLFRI